MRVSVYITCWIILFGISVLPLLPPVSSTIISFLDETVLVDTYYITATFKPDRIPGLLTITIMLIGSMVNYCIYKGHTCNWRAKHVKSVHFVPGIYNDEDAPFL